MWIISRNAKEDLTLNKTQKQNEVKKELKSTDIKKICAEDETTAKLQMTSTTIHNRYLAINPFMEEKIYKNLLLQNRK